MHVVKPVVVALMVASFLIHTGCHRDTSSQGEKSGAKNDNGGNIVLSIGSKNAKELKSAWVEKLDSVHDDIERVAKKAAGVAEKDRAETFKKISQLYQEHGDAWKKLEAMKSPASAEWNAGKKELQSALTKLKGAVGTMSGELKQSLADAKIELDKQKSLDKFREFVSATEKAIQRADTQIDILVNKARTAPTKVKADIYKQLSKVYQERTAARKQLEALRQTAGKEWDALRDGVVNAMRRLDEQVQAAGKVLE